MQRSPMNDLEELKTLLFGAEKQALDSITERVQKPETRAVDVADVLPEAIHLSQRQGAELAASLREPVGECLRESFHKEPKEYADALYPVMGPAIRKSIVSALRAFAQQINETIEQSLSARGLKWRFEAWRAGVPFGDYVVQRTLLYRIEQAYLISRDNGLLISHVHHEASRIKDSDAVSAMFTAIQDFIKESFSPDRSGRLETADMGDFTLWAVHGPHALLVCVIRGVPPRSLRADLSAILERIHFRHGDSIRDYAGDTATMAGVEEQLADCLNFQAMQARDENRRRRFAPLIIVGLLIAATVAYFGYGNWKMQQQQAALEATIADTPGWHVSSVERDGQTFVVRGLRDPASSTVAEIAAGASLSEEQLVADMHPFQSLDPEMVFLRAREALDLPTSVSATLADGGMRLSGAASQAWLDRARLSAATGLLGLPVNFDGVTSSDLESLRAEVETMAEAHFYFGDGAALLDADSIGLQQHAAAIARLASMADDLGAYLHVSVTGHTDPVGTMEFNNDLAGRRAAVAQSILVAQGVDPRSISRSIVVDTRTDVGSDPERKRATIGIALLTAEDSGKTQPE